ncbi:WYL domain-containing protein [Marinomonas sp. THO17]|uniref:WYL domain-containing protein n=1 Tax=Marinomonas sp. THO17 TaxID=3149048 RepID=UPI00336BF7AA
MELNQRLWMLELLVYWEGKVNTTPLRKVFGLSRQSVSTLIGRYLDQFPASLEYHPVEKAYLRTTHFVPHYINQTLDEYLDWMNFGKLPTSLLSSQDPTQYRIQPLSRYVSPDIIRPIIKAVKNKTAIDCQYLSVSSGEAQERLIYPHSFVKAANRWHIRAYCELRQQYLDFVLSRFQQVDYDGAEAQMTIGQDAAWHTQVELILAPDFRLNAAQKKVLEKDYGMQQGQLSITTRAALVKYTLDEWQIKTKFVEADPQAQQLICVNYADIKQWFYD